MHFSEDKISEIIEKNDIVDVISGYLSLKRSGNNYTCLCPFHSEKTPSFSVSSAKQIYYCFGCGAGGNVISFVQKIERMTFVEAVKFLADRAHVELKIESNKDLERLKLLKTLYNINTETARYYYKNLTQNKKSMEYLKSRGLNDTIIRKFGLGYAPDAWDSIIRHLSNKGFSLEVLKQTGLIVPRKDNSGFYDRFRNRVIFPIIDLKGNVIAFGGRVMDDSKPKYLNSPDTPVFNKGYNIYGLNFAKQISDLKNLIIVEGYMDVISLHQFGIQNAVASLGTAFTEHQAKLLKRYSNEIIIAYDSDTAGQAATQKGLAILEKHGCTVKVLRLPSGKDPDEFIRKEGVESFRKIVENSVSLIQYKIENAKKGLDIENIQDRIKFAKAFAHILKDIESNMEIDAYVKKYSKDMMVSEESIYSELNRLKDQNIGGNNRHNINDVKNFENEKNVLNMKSGEIIAERNLLNICMQDANKAKYIFSMIDSTYFSLDVHKKIADIINLKVKEGKTILAGEILNYFLDENEKTQAMVILNNDIKNNSLDEINSLVDKIKQLRIDKKIKELTALVDELYSKGEWEKSNEVFREITQLQKMKK